ncbi:hypothetical protein DCS32_12895 [Dokdonia sp. Dokd-P16]|uniref:hypothetical protein n=1 Tax=Dokdonia sp. Dokd-P16 TaxID=2173169 RepID=UPI000D543326|nr:hypothetical protein [Dokdonia sp. Dokd-P16]AWH75026.1 hypothetical protein DCS32_12895 [Dokdonia sp. Dokd-P16]
MNTFIKKYTIEKWWVPLLIFIASVIIFFATIGIDVFPPKLFLIFGVVVLFLGGVIQIFNNRRLVGFLNVCLSVLILSFIAILVFSFNSLYGPTDSFADNLELPDNVLLEKPLNERVDTPPVLIKHENSGEILSSNINFQLYNSYQPGLYEYDLWIQSDQSGTVFLKVYKITQEMLLSSSSVMNESSIRIENTQGKIKKYSSKDDFTIYEGDWGQPYGARFELWFIPDDTNEEKKIAQKNYIIEGWMR